jgi:hypothetical protein
MERKSFAFAEFLVNADTDQPLLMHCLARADPKYPQPKIVIDWVINHFIPKFYNKSQE